VEVKVEACEVSMGVHDGGWVVEVPILKQCEGWGKGYLGVGEWRVKVGFGKISIWYLS